MSDSLPIRPIEIGALERYFRDAFDAMLGALGLGGETPAVSEDRAWHPMDHTEPPYCPYVDSTVRSAASGSSRLELRFERSHWNDTEIAQATVSVFAKNAKGYAMISAHTTDFAVPVVELTVVGDVPQGFLPILDGLRDSTSTAR